LYKRRQQGKNRGVGGGRTNVRNSSDEARFSAFEHWGPTIYGGNLESPSGEAVQKQKKSWVRVGSAVGNSEDSGDRGYKPLAYA